MRNDGENNKWGPGIGIISQRLLTAIYHDLSDLNSLCKTNYPFDTYTNATDLTATVVGQ